MIQSATYRPLSVLAAYDPTKTTSLRNLFAQEMVNRFARLTNAIRRKVVDEDCFGLSEEIVTFAATNTPKGVFAFPRSADKVAGFMQWLDEQVRLGILQISEYEQIGTAVENAWTNKYITDSYKRGVMRARYELQKAGFDNIPSIDATGGISMSMSVPLHMNTLGLLYTRTFTDLRGITAAMDTQISRILTQGIADGDGARLLARKLVGTINGTGMGDLSLSDTLGRFIPASRRAEMLARTEIIRAHHQATIQEYRNWAVEGVIVLAEMVTAGDDRVCAQCDAVAAGGPYTLDIAMNLIPVHPNCRCVALPFDVKSDSKIVKLVS